MATPNIIGPFLGQVDAAVTGFYLASAGRVAAAAVTPFRAMVTIYILLWGLAFWRGLDQRAAERRRRPSLPRGPDRRDRSKRRASTAPASHVSLQHAGAARLGRRGRRSDPGDGNGRVAEQGQRHCTAFMDLISITDIGGSFAAVLSALIVWLFTAVLVLYGTALILLSKVILGIVIALGPLFIALAAVRLHKRFFEGWLGQALNYLFVYVLGRRDRQHHVRALGTAVAVRARQLSTAVSRCSCR